MYVEYETCGKGADPDGDEEDEEEQQEEEEVPLKYLSLAAESNNEFLATSDAANEEPIGGEKKEKREEDDSSNGRQDKEEPPEPQSDVCQSNPLSSPLVVGDGQCLVGEELSSWLAESAARRLERESPMPHDAEDLITNRGQFSDDDDGNQMKRGENGEIGATEPQQTSTETADVEHHVNENARRAGHGNE